MTYSLTLLFFLFTKETGMQCKPIYASFPTITIIIIKITPIYDLNIFFFSNDSRQKLIVERTTWFQIDSNAFVSILQTIQYMQYTKHENETGISENTLETYSLFINIPFIKSTSSQPSYSIYSKNISKNIYKTEIFKLWMGVYVPL